MPACCRGSTEGQLHLHPSYFQGIFLLALPPKASQKSVQKPCTTHFCASYRPSEDVGCTHTGWVMEEAGRFLRIPSPEHWMGWAECGHSPPAFPEVSAPQLRWSCVWGLCTSTFSTWSTKQYLTFPYMQQIRFIFFPFINRNIFFVISKKKCTRFENYFCRNPLSASLQKCSKS